MAGEPVTAGRAAALDERRHARPRAVPLPAGHQVRLPRPDLRRRTCSGRPSPARRSPPSAACCGPACTTSPTPTSSCSSRCSPARPGCSSRPSPSTTWPPDLRNAGAARDRRLRRRGARALRPATGSGPGYGIDGPFLLYAGRREGAKGWEQLLARVRRGGHQGGLPFDLTLVTFGAGDVNPPAAIADRVIDLGLPARRRARQRLRRRRRLRPAPALRGLLPHDHGGLAGRHPGDRQRRVRRRALALRALRRRPGLPTTTPSSSSACGSSPTHPRRAPRWRARARLRARHYTWDDVLDAVEAQLEAWLPAPADVPEPTPVGGIRRRRARGSEP